MGRNQVMSKGFDRIHGTESDFQEKLSEVEKMGMKKVIKMVFEHKFDFDPLPLCYFTDYNGYTIFTYQDNETELEPGVRLSHFVLTHAHQVLAVGFDEDDNEVYYWVKTSW
jgi:hypothetical protein